MKTIIGVIGFLAICLAAIKAGGPISIFFDMPSLLIVLGSMICLGLAKHSLHEIKSFSDEVVLSLINISLISGAIGFFIGLVQMLQYLSDPSLIGPAMAVCVLTVFYSLIISACLYASKKSIQTKKIGAVALGSTLAIFIPFLVMMLSFAK